ncbi:hypothetical protein G7Y89_g3945 [Cudoniella acicularis]|uniref:HMG box domain-containing protein n=1 Tax=Cudoniella acicularis TaxID=354080 RepID=A0A8H4RSG9_9HELO|nr:hypothetical protein G7Y89_g3945 [Cudoniella acicularis]
MTELGDIFAELGISHYLNDFIEQGFDTWDTILDITESDFDALGVKLGHRRKLQRKIANSRGVSSDRALASPRHTPSDDRQVEEQRVVFAKTDGKDGNGQSHKRKYRRHPKPDEAAPERPPSAYVIFSNKMREELKGRNLSFTEIAKLVGENWQNLSPGEKEPYEQQAFSAKERYNNELADYKKTSSYREYSQYLAEFKARQANQQQDLEVAKRPKLEPHTSVASNGTASSGTPSSGTSIYGIDTPTGRTRVESSASSNSQWPINEGGISQTSTTPKPNSAHGTSTNQGSPDAPSPTLLPGYREAIFGGTHQGLPWREGQRDECNPSMQKLPRLSSVYERRSSYGNAPIADGLNLTGSAQHAHRTGQTHPPPLLTSESTNRSNGSSASTASSTFYTPRTPLEPPLDRALPIPTMYSQKPNGSLENQLPPLRPPSLSPQSGMLNSQQSPNAVHPFADFPASMPMAPFRGLSATSSQPSTNGDLRARDYSTQGSSDDNNLDPVSALLKAGEIVNRNSRNQSGA